jgi:hypothetical protein
MPDVHLVVHVRHFEHRSLLAAGSCSAGGGDVPAPAFWSSSASSTKIAASSAWSAASSAAVCGIGRLRQTQGDHPRRVPGPGSQETVGGSAPENLFAAQLFVTRLNSSKQLRFFARLRKITSAPQANARRRRANEIGRVVSAILGYSGHCELYRSQNYCNVLATICCERGADPPADGCLRPAGGRRRPEGSSGEAGGSRPGRGAPRPRVALATQSRVSQTARTTAAQVQATSGSPWQR